MRRLRWWIPVLALVFIGGIWAAATILGREPYAFLAEAEVYQFKIWPKGRDPDLVTITYAFRKPFPEVVSRARAQVPGPWRLSTRHRGAFNSLISIMEWREAVRPAAGAHSDMPMGTTCTAYIVRQATWADRYKAWIYRLRGKPTSP